MDEARQQEMLKLFSEYRAGASAMSQFEIENRRNIDNIDLFEAIIREVYDDVVTVVAGHHIMFIRHGHSAPYEIASADTLIFDHGVASRIWGERCPDVLTALALVPTSGRDALLRKLFFER